MQNKKVYWLCLPRSSTHFFWDIGAVYHNEVVGAISSG
ncbi:conserved domain protein (plasmid) [Bacillus cereus AH820]|uniref:Conserved domain protein n=1 Tax=Bacillus cereus (strain AH820) TaxID=405535 RepID=B7JTH3_BACC0|nr:conserved domain protein [Bacillus cereus AH820]